MGLAIPTSVCASTALSSLVALADEISLGTLAGRALAHFSSGHTVRIFNRGDFRNVIDMSIDDRAVAHMAAAPVQVDSLRMRRSDIR